METLVICIDRDNDLGEKAKVITPVVGRGANIAAAVSLATVDPEDSDTNTIFGGVRILDELRSLGVDADIVSFAGDKNVGTISDKKIADQLDEFLAKQDVKSAIFVSDGAEDESLLPLVQSRVKVDSVQRIIVMQSERLESTYYMIKNFLRDPKFLQTFFVPIGMALIIFALAMIYNRPDLAVIGTLFIVGSYMILRAYALSDRFVLAYTEWKKSFKAHQLSFVTTLAAALLLLLGTIVGSISLWNMTNISNVNYYGIIPLISLFVKQSVLWYAIAFFIFILGKVFDRIRAKQDYQGFIIQMLFVLAGTLLLWSSGSFILSITIPESGYVFYVEYLIISVVLAVIISLVGIFLSVNRKVIVQTEEKIPYKDQKKAEGKTRHEKVFSISTEEESDEEKESSSDSVKVKINITDD
jgi:putative membrane protein